MSRSGGYEVNRPAKARRSGSSTCGKKNLSVWDVERDLTMKNEK